MLAIAASLSQPSARAGDNSSSRRVRTAALLMSGSRPSVLFIICCAWYAYTADSGSKRGVRPNGLTISHQEYRQMAETRNVKVEAAAHFAVLWLLGWGMPSST